MKTEPLLSVGTFGLHLIKNPAGTFSFVGTVPASLSKVIAANYEDGMKAFKEWFLSMNKEDQREHAANLRNDVFGFVFG